MSLTLSSRRRRADATSKKSFGSSEYEMRVNAKRRASAASAAEHATCARVKVQRRYRAFLILSYYAFLLQVSDSTTTVPTKFHEMTHILNISSDYIAVARPRFPPRDPESRIKFISTSLPRMNMKRGTGVSAMGFQGHAYVS